MGAAWDMSISKPGFTTVLDRMTDDTPCLVEKITKY